jgi:hypothetical protein
MSDTNFKMIFKGRRSLSLDNKRIYKVLGTVEIVFGSICLFLSIGNGLTLFYLALLFTGIFSILYALIGKYWMAEKCFIIISPESVEFKNLSQRPRILLKNTLRDVMIESNKAVFITTDQHYRLWDFSVFKERELKKINIELLKIKLELNKKSR